ncbi:flap endonuclease-1 [Methanosalsum natronophilum]|uniref:flap endonuclease-1 n=1 Tax=Methanosalsum natronophilum TaxID=768733 RepID=UPI002169F0C9|nr:flap endonuclease-1 [Methanosalsum natronophilum]MCS3923468.1 flap endonuclease-1 [Methanosalsum natronophilum]
MGSDIGSLLKKKNSHIEDLHNKKVAFDAHNVLYQFLSIIRQRDGTPLKDSNGLITSHLSGIFYRFLYIMEEGIKPIFVFDGNPPELKRETLDRRKERRQKAQHKWDEAVEKGLEEEAFKYSQASVKLDDYIIESSKELLNCLGIPFVEAPGEGEAQAAHMVINGDVDFTASQDYDALLFGSPLVIRNLTITGKRKLPGKNTYVDVQPEIIDLELSLSELEITYYQLIDVALCVGTDYNQGLYNIGPKKAVTLIKKYSTIENLLKSMEYDDQNIGQVKKLFLHPLVTDKYKISWENPNKDKLINLLCKKHNFSEERVSKAYDKLIQKTNPIQRTLDQF